MAESALKMTRSLRVFAHKASVLHSAGVGGAVGHTSVTEGELQINSTKKLQVLLFN